MKCRDSFGLPKKIRTKTTRKKRKNDSKSGFHPCILICFCLPCYVLTIWQLFHCCALFCHSFCMQVPSPAVFKNAFEETVKFFSWCFQCLFISLKEKDFLGHVRVPMRENHSTDADPIDHLSGSDVNGGPFSSSSSNGNISPKPFQGSANSRSSKPKCRPASMGSVSSFRGKEYVKAKLCPFETPKPLKLDAKLLSISDSYPDIQSDPIVEMQKETEDFLFKMLEDGFELDRDVIEEVFGKHF